MLLTAIAELAPADVDPFTDAGTLRQAVSLGLLDAPHLRGNQAACGKIVTRMVGGACLAVDADTGKPMSEAERTARALTNLAGTSHAATSLQRQLRKKVGPRQLTGVV